MLKQRFSDKSYVIRPLDEYFGKGVYIDEVEALVATRETVGRVQMANLIRKSKNIKPLETVVVETLLADDGKPISSSRIRVREIDINGNILEP